MNRLVDLLKNTQPFFLDSSCFIYTFEQHPLYHDVMKPVFNFIPENSNHAYTSIITVTEVLTEPMQNNNSELINNYLEVFFKLPNLNVFSPTYQTAVESARLRAKYSLATPDAYQIASALECKCKAFVTNDKGLKKIKELKVILLSDLIQHSQSPNIAVS